MFVMNQFRKQTSKVANPDQLKRFIGYGIIFEIVNNLHRPFAIKFLERLGGNELMMSLFNAMPGFITLFAVIPGAMIIRKFNNIQLITQRVILLGRFFLLGIAFIPIMDPNIQAGVFLVLFSLMCFPDSIYTTAFQTLIGKMFNEQDRTTAISLKNQLNVPLVTLMTLLLGRLITSVPSNETERMLIYQCFYLLAFLMGLIEYRVFKKFKIETHEEKNETSFIESIKMVFKDKRFVFFMICSLSFHFGWQMGWPLFNIYTIKTLGADEMWLAVLSVASSITMYFGYGFWRKRIHLWGNARVLAINAFGMAITPILYAWSFNLLVMIPTSLVSGFFVSGTVSVLFTSLLEVTPEKDRVSYLAVYNTLTNVTLAISPLVSHFFQSHFTIFGALYITALFRIAGSLMLYYRSKVITIEKAA